VELNDDRGSFSELIGRRVEDGSGRSLGRVFEVRGHWQRDGTIVLDELLVGRGALWKRLRGPGTDARGVPWESVAELSRERIVIRA
jgi:hypothetical protein